MNAEVDEIIHLMRQSKMDNIRAYLEKVCKQRDMMQMNRASMFIDDIKKMFTETSTPKKP